MQFTGPGRPLEPGARSPARPGPGQVLLRVSACGVCRTDLRRIVSVANLTRRDGMEFLDLAPRVPITTAVETFPLEQANVALARLREGRIIGAAVLIVIQA